MGSRDGSASICSLKRATWWGALTALPSGAAIAGSYYVQQVDNVRVQEDWSWLAWTVVIAVVTPIIGAFWAAGSAWGIRLAARRFARGKRVMVSAPLGGFLGGSIGGIIPMAICVGGFGSLNAPYVGTANVAFGLLAGFSLFATGFAIRWDTERAAPAWRARALATLLVIVPFGLAVMSAITAIVSWEAIVVVFDWLEQQFAEQPVVMGIGALLTAPIVGGTLGGLLGMVTWLSEALARVPQLGRVRAR
jgi:hypothetical protein